MPDLLALEWDHGQVCGLLASVSPGRVQVRRSFVLAKPQIAAGASGSGPIPIEWLKSELSRLNITNGEVLVALPRDEAVVRRLEVPPTPDAELPVIVRFQAGVKSQALLDESSLDFIPLPSHGDSPGREILMATVSLQMLTEIRTITELAGLQLKTVSLTPAVVAELVARVETSADTDGESLVVARHGTRIEITVLRNQHLLFSHSARLSDDAMVQVPQAISAETSRAMVSLRGAVPHVKIARVWTLVGEAEHAPLAELLHRRLSCEVRRLDPLNQVGCDAGAFDSQHNPELFAGPLGLLWSRAEPRVPSLDFLDPRKPPVVRDTRKRKLAMIGGAIGGAILLIGIAEGIYVSRLSSKISSLQKEEAALATELLKGEPTMKSAKAVRDWNSVSVAWLDEMSDMDQRLPGTDRIYLSGLHLEPRPGANQLPYFHFKGFARTREDATKTSLRFVTDDERYRPLAMRSLGESIVDGYYPWQFAFDVQLRDAPKPGTGAKKAAVPTADPGKAADPVLPSSTASSTAKPPPVTSTDAGKSVPAAKVPAASQEGARS